MYTEIDIWSTLPKSYSIAEARRELARLIREAEEPSNPGGANTAWTERARLAGLDQSPAYVDGQIAAIAFVQGLTVVTANMRHFQGFSGIRVVDWRAARA
jgi:predicted nucleic acid-binding protein